MPDPLSFAGMYGNKAFLLKKQAEGFTTVLRGGGPQIGEWRVVGVFVVFHPGGKVVALITWKSYMMECSSHSVGEESFKSRKRFQNFVKKWKLQLSPESLLTDLLVSWDTPTDSQNL